MCKKYQNWLVSLIKKFSYIFQIILREQNCVETFCSAYCHVDLIMMVVMVLMLMTIIQSYSKLSYSCTYIVYQTSRREQSSTCFFGVFSLAPSCSSVASTCVSAGSQKHHHHHSNQDHHDRIHNLKNNRQTMLNFSANLLLS